MSRSEENLFTSLVFKYLPYWPLFVVLIVLSMTGVWAYLKFFATPTFEASATIIIKDEEKGVNESRMTESIDAFISNNIVENEIKIIHSRALMREVVNTMKLYAQVYEEGRFKPTLAYNSSPIIISIDSPSKLVEYEKVYFTYDESSNEVTIRDRRYPINKWVDTPFGNLKFKINDKKNRLAKHPLFFSLIETKKVTDALLASLSIEAESKVSTVVNLKLLDPVPERGEDILNTLIQTYNQLAVTERNKLAANTLEFVENRIKLVEKELENLETKVVQFKSVKGAIDLSEQGKLFLKNVGENDRKIAEVNTQLAILDKVEKYVIAKDNTSGIVPSTLGISDPVLSQLLQKLYDSEIEYQKLRRTTAENNPILLSLTEEIEKVRPSILENIRNQRANLQASRTNLAATNSQYNTALQAIPQKERELLEISRQQAIKNNAYSFLLQKREETVLSYAPTAGDSRIIDAAEASLWPVSPKPLYFYIAGAFLACGLGLAFITFKEIFSGKLLFRSQIEVYTNAPIVAELAIAKQTARDKFEEPTEASVVEQFRQLRVTMGLYGRSFIKKKIVITSSIPGEGKSFISSNLAYSLASSGKEVVLLDFDMRNPKSTQLFSLHVEKGLIEYMKGEAEPRDIVKITKLKNLSIIPAGIDIGDHTELLLNGKLEPLFSYLDKVYDYIIIDTPPVDLVSDAYLLSDYCDITLLVMRHAHTPKTIIQRLAQSEKIKTLNNVAIVFNGVKPRGFIKGQYGYGYGYGFESKYSNKYYRSKAVTKY
ncbi:GumC family protein [Pontibacter anaerobius]|uniref:non-specific protein-tyrosine kinase n=1 Tax=Pontibacter anaerobius TaxID=2993940 RepID=A0ABT3RGT0_9BACT|nr:polysaccharide biosynthesis tyrosine autokinase [Pontibacter anaerobius]MCX2740975.1 polysaccharide biosynthesis tyrosine autokinase [Pontibacter anaerobius]